MSPSPTYAAGDGIASPDTHGRPPVMHGRMQQIMMVCMGERPLYIPFVNQPIASADISNDSI